MGLRYPLLHLTETKRTTSKSILIRLDLQPQHKMFSTSNSEPVGKAMKPFPTPNYCFSSQATCLSPPAFCLVHMHEAIGFLGSNLDCENVKENSIGHENTPGKGGTLFWLAAKISFVHKNYK